MVAAWCSQPLYAQKKKTAAKKTTTQPPPKETQRRPDTVIVIKEDSKPVPPPPAEVVTRNVETVIIIDRATGKPKVRDTTKVKPVRDTVIVLKGYKKKGEEKEEDTEGATNAPTAKEGTVKVVKVNENCECIALNVKASDTLRQDDYVNYQFLFKNNCKETVWISSAAFGFLVFNKNGTPARVLRKLDYVKRYNYPDFVPLKPGEEYTFMFGDDAFYQYELRQGWEYKFTFTYYNNMKYRKAPTQTYMCSQFKDKMIFIK